jgi:hypothetical protein
MFQWSLKELREFSESTAEIASDLEINDLDSL